MNIPRMMELKLQDNCCSQIIMQMGLEGIGNENKDLVAAMEGLCGGAHRGEICGTLSAAVCLFYLIDREQAENLYDELYDWFEDSYGSVRCDDILKGDPLNKALICGNLIENTFLKMVEIFEDNDIPFKPIYE